MARSVIWTEDFCKKILAEISKYPDNLVVGMERAAEKYPQASLSTIKTYYYKKGAPLYKIRTECKSLVKNIRKIIVSPEVKKEIAAELGCTVDTVYNALNLTDPTTGEQPDRIRRMALERGGYKGTTINVTSYDTSTINVTSWI